MNKEKKFPYLHIIDNKIQQSVIQHPLDNIKDKTSFANMLKKDLSSDNITDISDRNNLFSLLFEDNEYNIYIEHVDGGGRDISGNNTGKKVSIPFGNKMFSKLIYEKENVMVMDVYFTLHSKNDSLIPTNEYVYMIVKPSQIYSAIPAIDISKGKKGSPSSRGVNLEEIQIVLSGKEKILMNKNENVGIVHPSQIKSFLKEQIIPSYKTMLEDAVQEFYSKTKTEKDLTDTMIFNSLRRALRGILLLERQSHCEGIGCPVSGEKGLIASHIGAVNKIIGDKTLSFEDKKKHIANPNNAFLFCRNHDFLFDKYLISFDNNGKILLKEQTKSYMNDYSLKQNEICVHVRNDEMKGYLSKHRQIFSQ